MSPMYMDSAQAFLEHAPRTLLREDAKRATKRTDNQQRPRWRNAGALRSPGSAAVTTTKTKAEAGTGGTANAPKEQGKKPYSGERLSTAQAKEIHQEAMRVAKATSNLNKEILDFSEDLHVSRALLRAQLASIREKLTALT